jgi:type I restriction enzyme S subunit
MKWEKNQLVNKTSYLKRGISPKYVEGVGHIIINQKCIRDNRIDFTFSKICDSQKTIPEEKILKKGDILINSTGKGTLGRTAQIKNDLEETLLVDTHITIVRAAEDVDQFFLGQLIRKNEIVIEAMGKGSTQQLELSRTDLGELELSFPPLPTQRKIASILSAYDDLIENNLKRIKLLEEKALMEYRILYSSSKLNEFPIEDVWEIKYGKNLPQTKITEKGKYPVYGAAGRIGFYEEFNYEFPVALVTSRGNGSGVAHRTNQAAFVTNNSFAFVPKLDFSEVHFHLAEMILRDLELTQLRSGTAQPQLTISGLTGVKMKLPKKEALIEFNIINDPSFDLIHTLEKQNTKLREARDILLPKLMNGQIEV